LKIGQVVNYFIVLPLSFYYFDQLLSSLRSGLARIRPGVSVTAISGAAGSNPCLQLEEFLKERWDLVIEILARPGASRLISASGLPFVSIRDGVRPRLLRPIGNCVGVVNTKTGMAIHDFASACLRRGVRSVLQVMALPNPYDVTDMLAVSEIRVTTLRVENPGMPEAVAMGGFSAVRDFFAAHPRNLPDLVLFTDDYAAQGGLIAMKSLGLRIPEDVAVVSHYNKGHGPIWEKPLTRLEMDPVAHGAALTRAFAAYLRGEPFPENFVLGSVWREGETF
jgi:DNA-binding LacI/PurR family transcriptional regulator